MTRGYIPYSWLGMGVWVGVGGVGDRPKYIIRNGSILGKRHTLNKGTIHAIVF